MIDLKETAYFQEKYSVVG